jgi:hypothetical protein
MNDSNDKIRIHKMWGTVYCLEDGTSHLAIPWYDSFFFQ